MVKTGVYITHWSLPGSSFHPSIDRGSDLFSSKHVPSSMHTSFPSMRRTIVLAKERTNVTKKLFKLHSLLASDFSFTDPKRISSGLLNGKRMPSSIKELAPGERIHPLRTCYVLLCPNVNGSGVCVSVGWCACPIGWVCRAAFNNFNIVLPDSHNSRNSYYWDSCNSLSSGTLILINSKKKSPEGNGMGEHKWRKK